MWQWGAEGATTPETLRQKDRAGDELLESERALMSWRSTEGVTPPPHIGRAGGNLSGPMTEGSVPLLRRMRDSILHSGP